MGKTKNLTEIRILLTGLQRSIHHAALAGIPLVRTSRARREFNEDVEAACEIETELLAEYDALAKRVVALEAGVEDALRFALTLGPNVKGRNKIVTTLNRLVYGTPTPVASGILPCPGEEKKS